MTVTSKPIRAASTKTRYHSRLGIVMAKELGDIVGRKPRFGIFLVISLFVVPLALALAQFGESGIAHDAPSLRAMMEDNDVRSTMPVFLWLVSLTFGMIAQNLTGQPDVVGIVEPLLVTSARRWDIVGGKMLAFGVVWFGYSIIQAAMLAVVTRLHFVVALCPFLSYFHAGATFFVKFALVLTFGGWSTSALLSYFHSRPADNTFRVTMAMFGVTELTGLHWPVLWPLLGFVPMLNANNGFTSIFTDLPYDHRVVNRLPHVGVAWDHPHLWLACIVGGAIITFVLAALIVRNLSAGVPLSNTAK